MPLLIVENSLFVFNEATQIGGAGAVLQYSDDLIVQLTNNEGQDNIDTSGQCDDFALYISEPEPGFLCVAADEDLRLPTQPELSPSPAPSNSPPPVSPNEQPFHSDTPTPSLL